MLATRKHRGYAEMPLSSVTPLDARTPLAWFISENGERCGDTNGGSGPVIAVALPQK
jgi:hypothetical protein